MHCLGHCSFVNFICIFSYFLFATVLWMDSPCQGAVPGGERNLRVPVPLWHSGADGWLQASGGGRRGGSRWCLQGWQQQTVSGCVCISFALFFHKNFSQGGLAMVKVSPSVSFVAFVLSTFHPFSASSLQCSSTLLIHFTGCLPLTSSHTPFMNSPSFILPACPNSLIIPDDLCKHSTIPHLLLLYLY